jgi:RNA polymerase sigma-70 factor (ECF subfamily)
MSERPTTASGKWTVSSRSAKLAERQLLEAAYNGDEDAFRHLVETHRAALLAHCYRMLGSLPDAEDALQDTLLRAWRGLSGFDGRSTLRRWLFRIATNACLDAIARRPRHIAVEGTLPAAAPRMDSDPDQLLLEDGYGAPETRYEQREAVEIAFVTALRHLPPRQRAVLVLREVLGFSAKEVSHSLGTTVTSVNSALQRARNTVDERVPEHSEHATVRALGDGSVRAIVEPFVDAFERGDVEAIVALLDEDAEFAMPPDTRRRGVTPAIGADRTASFLRSEPPPELAA